MKFDEFYNRIQELPVFDSIVPESHSRVILGKPIACAETEDETVDIASSEVIVTPAGRVVQVPSKSYRERIARWFVGTRGAR